MEKSDLQKKPRVFYGYWIVLVAFLCCLIVSGVGYFGFGLFVKPLQVEFGWTRGSIMAAWTIFALVMGVASPLIGRLIDRYGAKAIIFTGTLMTGLGLVLLSVVNHLWQLYIGYAVIGVGAAATGIVPPMAVVSNWFKERRGIAIGITSTGAGGGGFVFAPIIGSLLIPSLGWRASFLALALMVCVLIIPLTLLVLKNKPADMGLHPDGRERREEISVSEAQPPVSDGLTLKMALATSAFWLMSIAYFLTDFSIVGIIQNQVAHFQDIGFSLSTAANVIGVVSLTSAIGKFLFGTICDRMAAKYAYAISCVFQVVAIAILISIKPTSHAAIMWLYAVTMGLGAGAWLPTMSMIVSTSFGLAFYGAIFGTVYFIQSIGPAMGPLIAGYMYDAGNTYHGAFILFLSVYVVALPAVLLVRRTKWQVWVEEMAGQ